MCLGPHRYPPFTLYLLIALIISGIGVFWYLFEYLRNWYKKRKVKL